MLDILGRISSIAAYSEGLHAKLESFLNQILAYGPDIKHASILLVEKDELVPYIYWPPDHARASFSIAAKAVAAREAIIWKLKFEETAALATAEEDEEQRKSAPSSDLLDTQTGDDFSVEGFVQGKNVPMQPAVCSVPVFAAERSMQSLYVPMPCKAEVVGLIHVDVCNMGRKGQGYLARA